MNDNLKLYVVKVEHTVAVGANNEEEAKSLVLDLVANSYESRHETGLPEPIVNASQATKMDDVPLIWRSCSLFNTDDTDNLTASVLLEDAYAKKKRAQDKFAKTFIKEIQELRDAGFNELEVSNIIYFHGVK